MSSLEPAIWKLLNLHLFASMVADQSHNGSEPRPAHFVHPTCEAQVCQSSMQENLFDAYLIGCYNFETIPAEISLQHGY
ncbi:hypothetical protein BgiMline_005932 [Biomphalaria glabrata]|nr:hypothetical protein BgiMline_003922 [Biomphalaria glabrata]